MSKIGKARCLTLLLLLSINLSQAQSAQVGNLLFNVPAGWQQSEQGGSTVLTPPDVTQGRLLAILFTGSTEVVGDARATFESLLADALGSGETLEQESDLQETTTANGLTVFSKILIVSDSGGTQTTRVYLGYDGGSRLGVIVVAASDPALFDVYAEDLRAFQQSIALVSSPPETAQHPSTTAPKNPLSTTPSQAAPLPTRQVKLQGLYYGSELRNQLNFATNTYEYRTINYYYLFSPDGRVYYGLPPAEWIENFDTNVIAARDPGNLGYYSVSGGEITFSFPDKESYSRTLERVGERLFLSNVQLDPVKPLPSGVTLDGTYYHQRFTNISTPGGVDAGGIEGGVSGQSTITFFPDGRFDSSSFVGSAASGTAANATTSETQSGSGTYSFQNYQLLLNYDDSTQQVVSFFVNPQEGVTSTPELVFIDGIDWLRQK